MAELQSLPLFHQIDGQKVLVLGDGEAAEPKRRLVERAGGIIIGDSAQAIDDGVRIAFVAYSDPKACEATAINLRRAGMLVNVVDRPELCDFTTPSVLDRNPLLIAVGTGGASAGLAKHVRLRLERLLPATLGKLARALQIAKPKLRERFPDGAKRRRAIDAALQEGGVLDPIDPAAHERVATWAVDAFEEQGTEWHDFTIDSADPDDLTIRQARLLGEADAICLHGDVPDAILARSRADAQRFTCDGSTCPLTNRSTNTDAIPACASSNDTATDQQLTVILRYHSKV